MDNDVSRGLQKGLRRAGLKRKKYLLRASLMDFIRGEIILTGISGKEHCMVRLYLLSGFVSENKATKRVEVFQRSSLLRLRDDLQR